jgi:tetraacyldisaccharide 4'-kinase
VRILRPALGGLSRAVGDEGAMVAMRCPDVPLVFSRDRRRAVDVACDVFDPTHVILDDSFQTWSVTRDVDIVLLDAEHPLGNGRILPAGSLRESAGALRRADAIGFNGVGSEGDLDGLSSWVRRTVDRRIPVFGVLRRLSFVDAATGAACGRPAGRSAALSSIARPSRFETSLVENGLDLCLSIRYPDHHKFEPDDIEFIDRCLADRGIEHLITTEKDWPKLRENGVPSMKPILSRLELDVVGDDPVPYEKPQGKPAALSSGS